MGYFDRLFMWMAAYSHEQFYSKNTCCTPCSWPSGFFCRQLKLDEVQVREQEALRVQLQQEQELLSAYQSKQAMQLKAQHEREEKDLQEKVSVRRALLEDKVSVHP